jgi:GH43 family beta-xylosidase
MIFGAILFSLIFVNAGTFTNPVVSFGPDPWVIQHEGDYYYCRSIGVIEVFKSKELQDIGRDERKVVFVPLANTSYSKEIWAPELHYIQGKWYIYFAADDDNNDNHRIYVLESTTPQGNYVFKGKIAARQMFEL